MRTSFPRGSEWRKWDLQVHAPNGKLSDGYKPDRAGVEVLDQFCDMLEASDVQAFGITDYFSVDSYRSFMGRFKDRHPHSAKAFFFNLELRLNESVNRTLENVNVHLVFNPKSVDRIDKFLSRLAVVKTGPDSTPIMCDELEPPDYKAATVTRQAISDAFSETFGKGDRRDHFLVITAANNDGVRAEGGKHRKASISDEIDKTSDAFFGGAQNVSYFQRTDRYEDKQPALRKPVVAGSDSHSFEDLVSFLGKQFVREIDDGGSKREVIQKDVTWIKADLTYEGLKQMIYEPEPGERVAIGPNRPDRKEEYKVIRKVRFKSDDFPTEIEFNDNLCSIIGSRSSGKSALLAYIAHSIDPGSVEQLIVGPGEGDAYRWSAVSLAHDIEWANGNIGSESNGSVVYVPQNHLFEKSKDPAEVKRKIEPVLFKRLPTFESQYLHALSVVDAQNELIAESVGTWFTTANEIRELDAKLKELGDKKAIEAQQKETDAQINALRERFKLSEEEVTKYQEIRAAAAAMSSRNREIDKDLELTKVNSGGVFFSAARIALTPGIASLPPKLQEDLKGKIDASQAAMVDAANEELNLFRQAIAGEKEQNDAAIAKIRDANSALIDKHQKNTELEPLVKASAAHTAGLTQIAVVEGTKKAKAELLRALEQRITDAMKARGDELAALAKRMEAADQTSLKDIQFGLEYAIDPEGIERLGRGINLREKTRYVDNGELGLDRIRGDVPQFLMDLYTGAQKTKDKQPKEGVAAEALQLTEKILFTAFMEGDKIGGFSASTMTPGKRALFALRLILAESEDTWPLLIDQPEDDLDSRSIYDEVVPFLKAKKRERQIIMVSHNANLVIGSDSEQLVIANRHGDDRKNADGKQFNYLTGSLEYSEAHDPACSDTLSGQGACEHACAILDGGKEAFQGRMNKYQIR